jgi:tRNA(Ile)-lysidine synthase
MKKIKKLIFVLVDHSIRSDSAKEAKAVKNLFKQKKMNLVVLKNIKKIDKNIQSNARDIRYKLLADFCIKKGVKFITTAHHKDDQIETFLIRLSRGSGIQGLSAMNKITRLNSKVKLFRPLLNESKKNSLILQKVFLVKFSKIPVIKIKNI